MTDATSDTPRPMTELLRALEEPVKPRRRVDLTDTVLAAVAVGPPILVLAAAWLFVAFVGVTLLGGSLVCAVAVANDARNAAVLGDAHFLITMGILGCAILAMLGVATTGGAWLLFRRSTPQ